MRKKILPLILIIAALGIISYFVYDYISDRLKEDPSLIEASGVIEVSSVTLSSPSGGKLEGAFLNERDAVNAGDVVASMDTGLIEKQLDVTKANIAAARTQLDAAILGYKQTVEQSEKAVELAGEMKDEMLLYNHYVYYDEPFTVTDSKSTTSQETTTEYSGPQQLLNTGNTESSGSASSDSTSVSYAGTAQKQSVRVQLQDALNQYDLALLRLEQAKENDLAVKMAEDNLEIANAQLKLYTKQLEELELVSPIDGTVINRLAEPGEFLLPGTPVYEIGKLTEVTCDIYIPENKYGMVYPGQEVVLSVDSYPGQEFKGVISKIADEAEFTPKNIQTKDDRVTTVYRITIFIDNMDMKLKAGMPADVVIHTSADS